MRETDPIVCGLSWPRIRAVVDLAALSAAVLMLGKEFVAGVMPI
jgi:hypothetical protein